MKKLLALTLVLALCLGLAVPTLALAYETEEYEAYRAAHPEEMAALDIDSLLADWNYRDRTAQEQFMDYEAAEGESLEEAVEREYIEYRLLVAQISGEAEEYKAQYPQEWADFDADAYFNEVWSDDDSYGDAASYRAAWCILTDQEFADDMFVQYIGDLEEDADYGWDSDWGYGWDEQEAESTLTLMVNGVASSAVEVTAEDGVSYVDAAALREILGDEAVPADQTGAVALRAAAETAGWDVAWYDGGWWGVDQEVQLWDKAAYEARLKEEFGPLNDFMEKAMGQDMGLIFSDEPLAGHETVDVTWTRFSTLDGSRDYTLTLAADYTVQKGVVDITLTFDVAQILALFDAKDLAGMAAQGGFSVAQLTQLLKAGRAEVILDYNQGVMAYNVPLLALVDQEQAGWKAMDTGAPLDFSEAGSVSFVSTLYASMLTSADYLGAEYAARNFEGSMGALAAFLGKDCFSTQNGVTTYSLNTQGVNKALSALAVEEGGWSEQSYSFFKAFDLTCTLDEGGNMAMDMHIRPDVAGIAAAMSAQEDYDDYGTATGVGLVLSLFDMDITASGGGTSSQATSKMNVHWNNVGRLVMETKNTLGKGAKSPRQVTDVAAEVEPLFSAIGGFDGPTAILVSR